MPNKLYIVRFRPAEIDFQPVVAASVEIQEEHLVLLDAKGKLAALFLLELVESWTELSILP